MMIHSKIKSYSCEVMDNLLRRREDVFAGLSFPRRFYFIDGKFFRLYENSLRKFIGSDDFLIIEADENHKSYLKLADYYQSLIESGFTRNDCLVTFGGGILQDISGFIASTLYRGIPWVYIPTTLLAQADSCIGSKTSINFGQSKNLIGTFYPPDRIFIDLAFTKTLSRADFNSGLGEIIKFHLLSDAEGFGCLQSYLASDLREGNLFPGIIRSTLEIKKSYFEADEFDTGRRNLLNYGHCFGHALESASDFSISHGEAVIVGMGFANLAALRRGIMNPVVYQAIESILARFYPSFDLRSVTADQIITFMRRDKKRSGKDLTMIMAREVGQAGKYQDVTEKEIHSVFEEFLPVYETVRRQHKETVARV